MRTTEELNTGGQELDPWTVIFNKIIQLEERIDTQASKLLKHTIKVNFAVTLRGNTQARVKQV